MKIPIHRIVQVLAALGAGTTGAGQVAVDPTNLAGWIVLVTGAIVGLVTLINQIADPTTPTLPRSA